MSKSLRILFFLFSAFSLFGQTPTPKIIYDGKWKKLTPSSEHLFLTDTSNRLTIQQIIADSSSFVPIKRPVSIMKVGGNTVWFKFDIQNATPQPTPELVFQTQLPYEDLIEFYVVQNKNVIDKQSFSWSVPIEKREFKHRYAIFSQQLLPNQTYTLYFRVHKKIGSIWLPINIWEKENFEFNYIPTDYFTIGSVSGIFFLVAFFSLLLSFSLERRLHIYYATYLICVMAFIYAMQGYFMRFYADGSWLITGNHVKYSATLYLSITNILFVRTYLHWKTLPNKILWRISQFTLFLLIGLLLLMYFDSWILHDYLAYTYPKIAYNLYSFGFTFSPLVHLGGTLYTIFKSPHRKTEAYYYLFANIPKLVIIAYVLLSHFAIIRGTQLEEIDNFALPFMLETLVLTLVLAFRIKMIQDKSKALMIEKTQQFQHRLEAVLEAEERERGRIARDLHDSIGQMLSAAKMSLAKLASTTETHSPEIQNAAELIDDSIKEIREVSHNMLPSHLIRNGLPFGITQFANKMNATGQIKVEFQSVGYKRLDERTEVMLYRIFQELTNNILRHADAKKVSIELIQHDDEIILIVEDDGVGFEMENASKQGIGLRNLTSRIEYLNGTIDYDSIVGRGTIVVVEIPIKESLNGA